jgi:decaprenylphospho-beta-D-ribofuranose 2-oxidase
VVLQLFRVPGNRILVDTFRTSDLKDTMTALEQADTSHRYSVAWVDLTNQAQLGRGVITIGNHTDERGEEVLGQPIIAVPPFPINGAVNRATVKVFNEMWFRKVSSTPRQSAQSYDKFFYPLDAVSDLNRVYGKRGFLQYQFVLPFESEHLMGDLASMLAQAPSPVSLAVLKRMGEGSGAPLSFPMPGWTLAADMPITASPHELESTLRAVDDVVASRQGRLYLAKDSRMASDLMPAMYPDLERFRTTRDHVDPERLFRSDLSERLGL